MFTMFKYMPCFLFPSPIAQPQACLSGLLSTLMVLPRTQNGKQTLPRVSSTISKSTGKSQAPPFISFQPLILRHPQKQLKADTFSQSKAGQLYNNPYVLVRMVFFPFHLSESSHTVGCQTLIFFFVHFSPFEKQSFRVIQ